MECIRIMKVKELIELLQAIENKDIPVVVDIGGDYKLPYELQPGDVYEEGRRACEIALIIDATGNWSENKGETDE